MSQGRRSFSLLARKIILVIIVQIPVLTVSAQCNGSITIGNDTTLCDGQTLILDPGSGFLSYSWQDGSTLPTYTATGAGEYHCQVQELDVLNNLVVNGDFSAGATGFTSGYVPGTGGTWGLLSLEGQYAAAANSSSTHVNFASCMDHTGGGNMLVVNGSSTPGISVWCQVVQVEPGTDYAFSAWLMSVVSQNPAVLQFTINGQIIGAPFTASGITCNWLQFYDTWNSGSNTSAEICITNQNTQVSGNDFALDDISFNPFCLYSDTVTVEMVDYPDPDLGPDQVICGEGTVQLDATYPGATAYEWNDGSTEAVLDVMESGIYWVHVFASSCMGRDSVMVDIYPEPIVDLGPDRALCVGDTIVLDATQPGAAYMWHDGSTMPTWTGSGSTIATVEVSYGPCSATDEVSLAFEDCGVEVVIPNVFSPNGDGSNATFTPIAMTGVRTLSMEVYNRWGQLVFTSSSINFAWNGRSGAGEVVPDGTYFWILNYTDTEGVTGAQHGTVTVLR